MKSFMLTEREYEELLKAKDLNEAFKKLAETIYAPYFKDVREIPWLEVEKRLTRALSDVYNKVIEMAPKKAREFLDLVEKRLEIETLKQLIRGCISGLPKDETMKIVIPMGEFNIEFCQEFLSKDLKEAIKLIKNEEIKKILEIKLPLYEKYKTTTPLEVALDQYILNKLMSTAKTLPKLDRKYCEHLIGIEIDSINITVIIRGKAMKLKVKDIKDMMIPTSYKLKKEIDASLGIDDPLEAYKQLASGHYIGKLPLRVNSIEEVEKAVKKLIINESHKIFVTYPFHTGLLYAFMNLKYYEVKDIRTILMGKYLNIKEDFIREHLLYAYKW